MRQDYTSDICPQRTLHPSKTIEGNVTVEIPTRNTESSLHSFKTIKTPTSGCSTMHTQGEGPGPTPTAKHLRSLGDVSVHTQGASYSHKPSSHCIMQMKG